jgi:hypothetical protein
MGQQPHESCQVQLAHSRQGVFNTTDLHRHTHLNSNVLLRVCFCCHGTQLAAFSVIQETCRSARATFMCAVT